MHSAVHAHKLAVTFWILSHHHFLLSLLPPLSILLRFSFKLHMHFWKVTLTVILHASNTAEIYPFHSFWIWLSSLSKLSKSFIHVLRPFKLHTKSLYVLSKQQQQRKSIYISWCRSKSAQQHMQLKAEDLFIPFFQPRLNCLRYFHMVFNTPPSPKKKKNCIQ